MSTPSPLLIAIAGKLAKHQLIRPSDYHDTIAILSEVPSIRSHAALVEALKESLSVMTEEQFEPITRLAVIELVKTALRQAEEGK